MGSPVVHFEINSEHPERSREFYAKLFDWAIRDASDAAYGLVNTGADDGINGGIAQARALAGVEPDAKAPAPSVTFYVRVDDLQKYLDRAVELGGRALVPPTHLMKGVTLAMFADPDGHVVGLVKG